MASHPVLQTTTQAQPTQHGDCTQERRITNMESAQYEHAQALSDGRVTFAEIQRDLAQIQATLAEIKVQIAGKTPDWVITLRDAAINWITLAVLGGIFWSVVKSGAVAAGAHP